LSPSFTVDVTECPIWQPKLYEWEYYSPKDKAHTLKYEVCVDLGRIKKIIWVNGPYKGSVHDLKIARDKLLKNMKEGERAMGDKGYIGEFKIIAPFKPATTEAEKKFNLNHYTIRQDIERINKRLKIFSVLQQPWRSHDLALHKIVFYVVAYLTQLNLQLNPLDQ
jgi:hypothetical protein